VIAMFHSGFATALIVLIFLGVLRVIQDYIIYPRLVGHGIHLHPLAIILAILCGERLGGVAGVFLAIPVVAIMTVSYRHWMEHRGSEGLADLLEGDTAGDEQPMLAVPQAVMVPIAPEPAIQHPTFQTTPDDMARDRPDLTTGELTLPEEQQ